jgi:hypothetical protein
MFINFDKESLFSINMIWFFDRISLMHRLFYTFASIIHLQCRKKSKFMSINVSISSFRSKKFIPQKLMRIDFCNFVDRQNSFLKLRQNPSISENFISSYINRSDEFLTLLFWGWNGDFIKKHYFKKYILWHSLLLCSEMIALNPNQHEIIWIEINKIILFIFDEISTK